MRNWRQSAGLTASELAIVRALLPPDDSRTEQLLRQAEDAPAVERQLDEDSGYRLVIPYVKNEEYLIDADADYVSPPITVTDIVSGRELAFTVKIRQGGFLNDLLGFAKDGGAWPHKWSINIDDMAVSHHIVEDWLPPQMPASTRTRIIQLLASWTQRDEKKLLSVKKELLRLQMPAGDDRIAEAEHRLSCRLPIEYQAFVRICDGLSIRHGRPYDIFGTNDVYRVDLAFSTSPLIIITDLYEKGAVVLSCEGKDAGKVIFVGRNSDEVELIGSLRTHVSDSLAWLGDMGN